jgi:hypothetical protein
VLKCDDAPQFKAFPQDFTHNDRRCLASAGRDDFDSVV